MGAKHGAPVFREISQHLAGGGHLRRVCCRCRPVRPAVPPETGRLRVLPEPHATLRHRPGGWLFPVSSGIFLKTRGTASDCYRIDELSCCSENNTDFTLSVRPLWRQLFNRTWQGRVRFVRSLIFFWQFYPESLHSPRKTRHCPRGRSCGPGPAGEGRPGSGRTKCALPPWPL